MDLVLLGLGVGVAVVEAGVESGIVETGRETGPVALGAVGVDGDPRVESGRAVLEREAHAGELALDLVDRLLPEVADVEQVGLAATDELADRVDAFALEAVVGADGEVHLLDRERSEERRVGEECRSRGSAYQYKKKE